MLKVAVHSYLSPTLVLLAFNWEDAPKHPDFTGFAIKRTPGFRSPDGHSVAESSWLPNRLSFDGPIPENQEDMDSNIAPIQKFMWWDNRIDTPDEGKTFTYEIWPVLGSRNNCQLQDQAKETVKIKLPAHVNANGIGTWFNRAVVRSQAFRRICNSLDIKSNTKPTPEQDIKLRSWLGNGMEQVVPHFLNEIGAGVGAIYHLTDSMFIIPAFQRNKDKTLKMIYDAGTTITSAIKSGEAKNNPNADAIEELGEGVMCVARTKTAIMHDKFIAGRDTPTEAPAKVIMGSANYTTEGLTEQANLIHTIESPELAAYYENRAKLLWDDPTIADTARGHKGWSEEIAIGTAKVRVNFSPEPKKQKTQINTIVDAIDKATSSVLFCLFSPTDDDLRKACFGAGDRGLMMFGLLNLISEPKPDIKDANPADLKSAQIAQLEIYHRSKDKADIIDGRYFNSASVPDGFSVEFNKYPGAKSANHPPVIIHHKFIIIDAETDHPIVYTGSANMSKASEHSNDENLLEIKGDTDLAKVYLAEFMRLYEHYRARANAIAVKENKKKAKDLRLYEHFSDWGQKYFKNGTSEQRARLAMVQ